MHLRSIVLFAAASAPVVHRAAYYDRSISPSKYTITNDKDDYEESLSRDITFLETNSNSDI